jgi:hypothetical protein
MIKGRQTSLMNAGLIIFVGFLVLVALSPLLSRTGDFDDRARRGWWVNR